MTNNTYLSWSGNRWEFVTEREGSEAKGWDGKSVTLSRDIRRSGNDREGCLDLGFNHVLTDSWFDVNTHVLNVLTADSSMIWLTNPWVVIHSFILIIAFASNDCIVCDGKTVSLTKRKRRMWQDEQRESQMLVLRLNACFKIFFIYCFQFSLSLKRRMNESGVKGKVPNG